MNLVRKFLTDAHYISYNSEATDVVTENIKQGRFWGAKDAQYCLKFIPKSERFKTFVDCGCHIGTFTLPIYQHMGKFICIDGFEDNITCLNDTLQQNHFTNIEAKLAIIDKTQRRCSFQGGGPFGSILLNGEDSNSETLDSLLKHEKHVGFIKLDIEGTEMDAILGGQKIIDRHRPSMFIEVNQECQETHNSSVKELFELLKDLNYYILYKESDDDNMYVNLKPKHHVYFPKGLVRDVICIPSEKILNYDCACGFCFTFNQVVNGQ